MTGLDFWDRAFLVAYETLQAQQPGWTAQERAEAAALEAVQATLARARHVPKDLQRQATAGGGGRAKPGANDGGRAKPAVGKGPPTMQSLNAQAEEIAAQAIERMRQQAAASGMAMPDISPQDLVRQWTAAALPAAPPAAPPRTTYVEAAAPTLPENMAPPAAPPRIAYVEAAAPPAAPTLPENTAPPTTETT